MYNNFPREKREYRFFSERYCRLPVGRLLGRLWRTGYRRRNRQKRYGAHYLLDDNPARPSPPLNRSAPIYILKTVLGVFRAAGEERKRYRSERRRTIKTQGTPVFMVRGGKRLARTRTFTAVAMQRRRVRSGRSCTVLTRFRSRLNRGRDLNSFPRGPNAVV